METIYKEMRSTMEQLNKIENVENTQENIDYT